MENFAYILLMISLVINVFLIFQVIKIRKNLQGIKERLKSGQENLKNDDELFEEAKEIVKKYRMVSASLLQRHLRVGYARAARLLDLLEDEGVIGSQIGSNKREIF